MIYTSAEQLVGKTPMLELVHIEKEKNLQAKLYAKLEMFNPAGSVKDRAAKNMLDDAEKKGLIEKDTVIIEPTSGNTGIGLAWIAGTRGYRVIIVMPDSMSVERIKLMKAYGAEVVLTEGAKGMKGAIAEAERLAKEYPHSFIPNQFENPANAEAHYLTTGPEILEDCSDIDILVAGIGTGGTITGTGKYLKEKKPSVKVVGVEPKASAVLNGNPAGPHGLQGIGAGFVPKVLDTTVYDEVMMIENEEAFETGRMLGKTEGVLAGISSGAALCAAIRQAEKSENKGKKIVVILPDTGERYLSSQMNNE